MIQRDNGQAKKRRGIYLLPNLFTTGCLFFGFYAIVAAMQDRFEHAAIAIFVAMILDGLDGRVARLTNTESEFGVQYDSLADMVSFGLAPSLVVFVWSLHDLGKLGWLASFLYTAGGALRLARFNTQVAVTDKRFFQGLPSPSAAAVIASGVWVGSDYGIAGEQVSLLAFFITVLAGVLMISNLRYYSFKSIDLKGKVPFVAIFIIVLIYVFISIDPPQVLFFGFLGYVLSGPVLTAIWLRQKRAERQHGATDSDGGGQASAEDVEATEGDREDSVKPTDSRQR